MLKLVYNFLKEFFCQIYIANLRHWGKIPSLTESFIFDARVGEIMSAMYLKVKLGIEFNEDFLDLKPLIILLTYIELVSKKKKQFCCLEI